MPNPKLHNALTIARLTDAKKTALRRGIWFRSLNRVERGIIDLTVKYVDNIKSAKLAKVVDGHNRKAADHNGKHC